MKTITLIIGILILAFLISSCSDNSISPGPNLPGNISGKIENWNWNHTNYNICAAVYTAGYPSRYILGKAIITMDGSFSVQFNLPPENVLKAVDTPLDDNECSGNINITPADTKYTELVLEVLNKGDSVIGYVERRNFDGLISENTFFSRYIYFNKNVSITGTEICKYVSDTTLSEYNVNANEGWSSITSLFTAMTPTYIAYTLTSSEPQGGKWYYFDSNDKNAITKCKYKPFPVK